MSGDVFIWLLNQLGLVPLVALILTARVSIKMFFSFFR